MRSDDPQAEGTVIGRFFRRLGRGVRSFGHRWLSLLVVSAVSYALWGLLTSPEFHVSVVSIRRITPPTLAGDASLVQIRSFTGLVGQTIFFLNPDTVTREIAHLPAVADARLFLVLPGQAIVEMAERQPEARWIANGIVYLISRDGEILGSDDAPELVVTIVDETGNPIRSGDRVDGGAVRMAFQLQELLATAGIGISAFHYTAQDGLSVKANEGWIARYGSAERLVEKTQALLTVLQVAREEQRLPSDIDLQPNESPTFQSIPTARS